MKTRRVAIAVALAAAAFTLTAAASDGRREEDRHDHDHEEHHGREEPGRGEARRGGGGHEGRDRAGARPADADPAYLKECGACHLAFPPSMLPAASWRRMMGELDRHFGQDAALDEPTRTRLEGWLASQAGRPREEAGGAPQRITGLAWFTHEHRRAAAAASHPAVRSLANCAACHGDAARWAFDEDRVRIPR